MKASILHKDNFFLIAGPCVIESREMAFDIAIYLHEVCLKYQIPFIFKGSYRKANRSRIDSFKGIGDLKALNILKDISKELNILTTTDIHSAEEASLAAEYVDILQIPAFLCRQTDLLVAAAKTGKIVNIKKGQFLSPDSMKFAVQKIKDSGNDEVLITERGSQFGYHELVVDFKGIPKMRQFAPVIMDVTHSLQQPNQANGVTGGQPELIETIAKAGIASGVDGLFIETHPKPSEALSDGANMLPLEQIDQLLHKLVRLKKAL